MNNLLISWNLVPNNDLLNFILLNIELFSKYIEEDSHRLPIIEFYKILK